MSNSEKILHANKRISKKSIQNISSDDSGIEDSPDSLPSSIEDEHNGGKNNRETIDKKEDISKGGDNGKDNKDYIYGSNTKVVNKKQNIDRIKENDLKNEYYRNINERVDKKERPRSKTFSLFGRIFKKNSYDKYVDEKSLKVARKSQTLPVTSKDLSRNNQPFNERKNLQESDNESESESENENKAAGIKKNIIKDVGITGLNNIDNSCYVNSIIQCLSHIDLFAEHFGCNKFANIGHKEKDKLSVSLSQLIKTLWRPKHEYNVDIYIEFIQTVGRLNKEFSYGEQQDAQEFFMWLIDQLHLESMGNSQREKKTKTLQKKKKGQSDAEQAVLAFASYTDFYQSYIQSLFISQYRSSIKCLYCSNYSNTYDPYLCISLSIPPSPEFIVFISIYFADKYSQPVKLSLILNRDDMINSIRDKLSEQYPNLKHFVMLRMKTNGLFTHVNENKQVSSLPVTENSLHVIELDEDYIENRTSIRRKDFINPEHYIHLFISNVEIFHKQRLRFGRPTSMNVSYDLPFKDLQSLLVSRMPSEERVFVTKTVKKHSYSMRWRLINKDSVGDIEKDDHDYMITSCEYPLHDQATYRNIFDHEIENIRCLHVLVEWEAIEPAWRFRHIVVPSPKELPSCDEAREKKNEKKVVSLNDCLQLQTQEEKLPSDIAWRCEFCRKKQEGLTKKLSLWSLPDILVIHLKRFDQYQGNDGKITTVVDYPVEGLNMFQYIVSSSDRRLKKTIKKASIRLNYQPPPENEEDCIYDLKGVCNHLGRYVNTGHYTAHCKNSYDDQWYTFDDRYVTKVRCSDVVISPDAYLLFYQRRNVSDIVKNRMSEMMTSSFPNEHWSLNIESISDEDTIDKTPEAESGRAFELAL